MKDTDKECGEVWRDVKGYEGLYRVSSNGKVKGLKGKYRKSEKRMKSQIINKHASIGRKYLQVNVHLSKNGKSLHYRVSRLVAIAFIPNPDNKPEVNHKDGNTLNNHVSNLEWVTRKENMRHASINGLMKPSRGEKNGSAKLNNTQVRIIKKLKGMMPQRAIAEYFGVTQFPIRNILTGKTWKGISPAKKMLQSIKEDQL